MGLPTNDYLRIISKSYGPRKPLVVCEASSLDMLADLDCAEGSTATVGGTEYVLDRVNGWVEPGSGGGGGSGVLVVNVTTASDGKTKVCDKTAGEMVAALENGGIIFRTVISDGDISGSQYTPLMSAGIADGVTYSFVTGFDTVVLAFNATSASEYPVTGKGPK